MKPGRLLKVRLGIAAALLGAGTLVTALILIFGLNEVADRLDTALAAETRIARYSALSQHVSAFLVVSTEAAQTGVAPAIRIDRISPIVDRIDASFVQLRADVKIAVEDAEALGLDVQSRYGTQSLGLARMEALLASSVRGLSEDTTDGPRLKAHIDSFASGFDPLLSQAVNTEIQVRATILEGIKRLRATLTTTAYVISALTILAVGAFYFGLIQPQFRRLDRLRDAAHQIADADFTVALPDAQTDEIGQIYRETNRMVAALAQRQREVEAEWAQLNQTIAERTEALRAANATLAEVDVNRRRFFADISHELRTPLTVILMEAQLGQKGDAGSHAAFATIEARAAKLNRRIDDLLRVARSDSGQLALDPKPVDLGDLLGDVTEEVQAEIDNAGMELRSHPAPKACVQCDPNWVRQVLVSLIRNAIRHARDGRIVALVAHKAGAAITITVSDNGPGIAAADQARVFERFEQGSSNSAQGFGVGLALARWVIETQGGQITLTSPLPAQDALGDAPGTKVALRLPVDAA